MKSVPAVTVCVVLGFALPSFSQEPGAPVAPPATAPAAPAAPGADAQEYQIPPGEALSKASLRAVSGVVNVLRQGERVEVVMRGGDIFFLPRGSKQAAIFKALQASEKNGSGVSIVVDDRTNIIQSVGSGGGAGGGAPKK